jgi:hypothetical protein
VPTGVRTTGREREVPADEGCPDGETSSRGIPDPYPLYIERIFCPRLCIFIEETNYYLHIPTWTCYARPPLQGVRRVEGAAEDSLGGGRKGDWEVYEPLECPGTTGR